MNAPAFIRALNEAGVTDVVGLPDLETAPVFDALRRQGPPRLIGVCREGEAFPLAAGLWAGGRYPLVLIQNTGFFESGDSLRSVAFELEAPLDVVIGYRGYSGKPNAGRPDTARDYFEPLLQAWGLPYALLDKDDDFQGLADQLRAGAAREKGVRVYLLPQ